MEHATNSRSDQQRGRPAAERTSRPSAVAAFVDSRPEAIAQRALVDALSNSPRMVAQRQLAEAMLRSPQVTSPSSLSAATLSLVQRQAAEDEELLQGTFAAVQRWGPGEDSDDDAEEAGDLEPDLQLPPSYRVFAAMSAADAKNRCFEAATTIGRELTVLGLNVEYVCVVQWLKGYEPTTTNHYAAIGNGVVFDATGQQDPGGEACVLAFSDWLARVKSRCAGLPGELSLFVRGSLADCQSLSVANQAYFWDMTIGTPVCNYTRKKIRELKKLAHKEDKHARDRPLPPFDFANEPPDDN